ncbi:hypothetical protein HO173_009757 [Letharia columbiana]|uniref:Uncharacterized protein n=1 Tax=Letharia columbiana TaxID=112416 RepID=A0A8H6FNS8_9LECA|nr:uncharacterized protein HO173_009757 [Letharia columbiana]KAF6231920.1 hypothetical protein HO173_009757 [Letharia columbiana]
MRHPGVISDVYAKPTSTPNSVTLQAGPPIHSRHRVPFDKTHAHIDPFDRPIDIDIMNSYAERLASFTSWPHVCPSASTVARAGFRREYDPTFPSPDLTVCSLCGLDPCDWYSDGSPFDFHATRSPECPFVRATQQKKKHRNQKTRQQYTRRSLQVDQPATHSVTQSGTLQEEEPLQAIAENTAESTAESTAEKASDNKATITKNTAQLSKIPRHMLSTLPRQTTTQQENDTTIWPAISACLGNITLWYITAMTIQEKDLLRRSQPNHYGQLGLCRGTSDDAYLDN